MCVCGWVGCGVCVVRVCVLTCERLVTVERDCRPSDSRGWSGAERKRGAVDQMSVESPTSDH